MNKPTTQRFVDVSGLLAPGDSAALLSETSLHYAQRIRSTCCGLAIQWDQRTTRGYCAFNRNQTL